MFSCKKSYRANIVATILLLFTPTYSLASTITLRSFATTKEFSPIRNLSHPNSAFMLETIREGRPYLWAGSDESLLYTIKNDRLIVCYDDETPVGFISYHTMTIPPYGYPYCDTCKVLKTTTKPKETQFIGHIHTIAIRDAMRGQGLGTKLIKTAIAQIREIAASQNVQPVIGIAVFPENTGAFKLYSQKFKFEKLGPLSYDKFWVLRAPTTLVASAPPSSSLYWLLSIIGGLLILLLALYLIQKRRRRE